MPSRPLPPVPQHLRESSLRMAQEWSSPKGHGLGRLTGSEIDSGWGRVYRCASYTESTITTFSPTFKGIVAQDSAGVVVSEGEDRGGVPLPQVDFLGGRDVACGGGGQADLAVVIAPPALDGVVV